MTQLAGLDPSPVEVVIDVLTPDADVAPAAAHDDFGGQLTSFDQPMHGAEPQAQPLGHPGWRDPLLRPLRHDRIVGRGRPQGTGSTMSVL